MSRIERLKQYANPTRQGNWQGASRDGANIDRWSRRAEKNSDGDKHRASDGPMKLPSTGKRMETRDTAMAPKAARAIDARSAAKADLNVAGDSPYLRGIRRNA